ncbi:MAG: polysaccharide pyruvyl transferase family protein [Pseudomonadota bacterium]
MRNNIGDVLQGYVAKRFLPEANRSVVDRENLASMGVNESGLLVANGWYMHNFDHFPPPDNISPLYVAVHIADSAMLRDTNIRRHFRKHSPVGCRDRKTLKLFLGWGIPAYYSGCLTITARVHADPHGDTNAEILLVDGVDHGVPDEIQKKLESLYGCKLVRVTHDPPDPKGEFEEYANNAEDHLLSLLQSYHRAKLIITTKIHCALPCLGMGLPVIPIHPNPSDPRLETLRRFTNIISFERIREFKVPPSPSVNQKALDRHRSFISEIVKDSVDCGSNAVRDMRKLRYRWIKARSIMSATAFGAAVAIGKHLPGAPQNIRYIYGAAQSG